MLFSDEPEVFLPKYSQLAILNAAHFRRVVKAYSTNVFIIMQAVFQVEVYAINKDQC